jgi:lipoyl(octanoyl) transferase
MPRELVLRRFGRLDYVPTWQAMRAFTDERDSASADELWCLEHPPVFTLGRAASPEHVRAPGDIPVVAIDRGGEVTYHGPGQLVVYTLCDLRRLGLGVRGLVTTLEAAVIELLEGHGVTATTRAGAPGVYVGEGKIAALGLRVRRGASFHGLALNVDCDLAPFARIDPCGYRGLAVTSTADQGIASGMDALAALLVDILARRLGYTRVVTAPPELESV